MWSAAPAALPTSYFVNAGGKAYTDHTGQTWAADEDFIGGGAFFDASSAVGVDAPLLNNRRTGNFNYDFPIADGNYTVTLLFADSIYAKAGQRVFDVTAQGQTILSNFDIAASGGAGGAEVVRSFSQDVTAGSIKLGFEGIVAHATVSGIEIVPAGGPTPTPTPAPTPTPTPSTTPTFSSLSFTAYRSATLSTPVTITRFNGSTKPLNPSVRTWVLVHGYMGNGHTAGITKLADELEADFPNDQVLTLDWSKAAADPTYQDTEQWLAPIGAAAASALTSHGFAGSTINLVGYSFGTYISDNIGAHIAGGVNTLLAIDPPEYLPDGPGSFDPETSVNFAAVSRFSMSFHDIATGTGHAGDFVTPQTATVAIDVTGTNHGAIIGLVGNLFAGTDPISRNFRFSNLLAYSTGPWAANRYNAHANVSPGGFDAVLSTSDAGSDPLVLQYFSAGTGSAVSVNV
jgi:pimeloyl-ACP methyl ester carboxylesterase